MKRAAIAIVLIQLAGLTVASAQTPPPPDEDEAAPSDLSPAAPPDDGAAVPVEPVEVVAEEVGDAEIDRGEKPTEVGYDKGFFIKSGDGKYSLKVNGRVQPFYAGTIVKAEGAADKHAFEIRRARLTLGGNIHSKALTYKMQSDFGKGFVTLKDFHFDVKLSESVWLRAGQWKRPFSRQQINSSGNLEITDRSITDKAFGAGRDIGVALRNDYEKSVPVEWIVGVFNGSGDGAKFSGVADDDGDVTGSFTNVPSKFKPVMVARVGINEGGIKGYSEADLEGGALRWGAAASVWVEGDYDEDDASNQKVELDYVVKANGFSTTGGFYGMTSQNGFKPFGDQELSHVGFHLQAGYMATPTIQAAARFALVDARPDFEAGSIKDQQEISVGGNYFAFGHDAKLAGAVRFIKSGDAKLTDSIQVELGANVGF